MSYQKPFYVSGSDTSKAAAESVASAVSNMRTQVLDFITSRAQGATDDEIEVALGMRHQTASARRRDLVLSGLVQKSGARRETRSGRQATVWEATHKTDLDLPLCPVDEMPQDQIEIDYLAKEPGYRKKEANEAEAKRSKRKKEKKMGNLVKYGSFDLDTLEKQDQLVESNSTVGADFMKLQPGKNKLRFLPPKTPGQSPFIMVNEHFLETPGGQKVRFACPRLMEKKPCPACQQADDLKRTGNPLDRDKAWSFYPKLRVYANVYDRENPGNPRILAFGKTIWEGLKRIRKDRDEGGDFTNPMADGFDIVITREGTGLQTKYAVSSSRSDSALSDDEMEIDRIIQAQYDLSKYSKVLTLDEVIDMMENGYQKKEDSAPRRGRGMQQQRIAPPSSAKATDHIYDVDSDDVPY